MKAPLAAIVLATALLPSGGAQAAPLARLALDMPFHVITVKDGCGVGFHRLSSGVCRPQPEGPRLMRLFARKCQLGYRRNLLGKCVKE
ncbi:hypothetical protein BH10PSE10_BH10PSE10_07080 [soil metagenome]